MMTTSQAKRVQTSSRTADLLSRYLDALENAKGKPVATDVMLELFRLSALDWKIDHGLIGPQLQLVESAVPAETKKTR